MADACIAPGMPPFQFGRPDSYVRQVQADANLKMDRQIDVRAVPARAPPEVEFVEHKGTGHPDTLTDGFCEAASRELSRLYLRSCGAVLHHNLDKGLLIAGRSTPRFGGGAIVRPMQFIVCGRATPLPTACVAEFIRESARSWLERRLAISVDPEQVRVEGGEGATALQQVMRVRARMPRANDTSLGVGCAPYTSLERLVLDAARELASDALRAAYPAAGLDFKVMGLRRGTVHSLTIALAMVDRHVRSASEYFELKAAISDWLAHRLPAGTRLRINALDDPHATSESGLYLSVSGLSAEMGDDGQVGRGNRVNGLITPGRPMSLEAAAGKNPVAHVGKIYNVLALLIARELYTGLDAVDEARVQLLSSIGAPLDQPQLASVELVGDRIGSGTAAAATRLVDERLRNVSEITDLVLQERVALF